MMNELMNRTPKQRTINLESKSTKGKFVGPVTPYHLKKNIYQENTGNQEKRNNTNIYSILFFAFCLIYFMVINNRKIETITSKYHYSPLCSYIENEFMVLETNYSFIKYFKNLCLSLFVTLLFNVISVDKNTKMQCFIFSFVLFNDFFLINSIITSYSFSIISFLFGFSLYLLVSYIKSQNNTQKAISLFCSIICISICSSMKIEFLSLFIIILYAIIFYTKSLLMFILSFFYLIIGGGIIFAVNRVFGLPSIIFDSISLKILFQMILQNDFNSLLVPIFLSPLFFFTTKFISKKEPINILILILPLISSFKFSISNQDTYFTRVFIIRTLLTILTGIIFSRQQRYLSYIIIILIIIISFVNYYLFIEIYLAKISKFLS